MVSSDAMNAFRAHVENGRIIVDDPTDLPDGTVLHIVPVNDGDDEAASAARTVDGSLRYIQHIATALPVSTDDERVVDALVTRRTAGLRARPLRRREGDPR